MSDVKHTGASPKTKWTGKRCARLGFLIGLGWEAKRIIEDPLIASTSNNVHRQTQRFGLSFRESALLGLRLSSATTDRYDAAAAKRGVTRELLFNRLLTEIANEPSLLDNILDDGI